MTPIARTAIGAALAVAALCAPAAAPAATQTLGSDLTAAATRAETKPVDTAYWPTAYGSGASTTMPTDGEVNVIRLKGMAVQTPGAAAPVDLIHFQVIRPVGGNQHQVIVTSEDFNIPYTGDPNQVTSYFSDFLCVKAGDRIAFNVVGGFADGYPNGVPMRVFGDVAGSSTDQYTKAGGTNNGQTLDGTRVAGEELLMQVELGTGPDARSFCGGTGQANAGGGSGGGGGDDGDDGSEDPQPSATIPGQAPHLRKRSILSVAVFCHGPDSCAGELLVLAKGKKIGSTKFTIDAKDTDGVRFRFNKRGRRLFRKSGNRLRVTAIATTDGLSASRTFTVTKR